MTSRHRYEQYSDRGSRNQSERTRPQLVTPVPEFTFRVPRRGKDGYEDSGLNCDIVPRDR